MARSITRSVWSPPLHIAVGRFAINGYRGMGVCGYVLAGATGATLAWLIGRSLVPVVVVWGTASIVFVALAVAAKRLTGHEYIVYFHHEIAVLGTGVVVAQAMDASIKATLDLTIIGVLICMAFGRIGCLMVGCCYGRPARIGVRYRDEHAHVGFPRELVGMTLTPVQAFESLAGLGSAVEGIRQVVTTAPGAAFAWCVASYGAARFFILEPRRADPRPFLWGLSHAQWLAAIRAAALLTAVVAGVLGASKLTIALALATVVAVPIRLNRGAR